MKTILFSVLLILVNCMAAAAQKPAPDAAELTRMLNEFLAGATRNDAAVHDRFWADDLIYTGSSGRRFGKAELMRNVRSAKPAKPEDPVPVYSAEDVRIQQYGDAAVVAFRLISTTEKDGKKQVARFLNAGTFIRRNGQWRVVAWQATTVPDPKPSPDK